MKRIDELNRLVEQYNESCLIEEYAAAGKAINSFIEKHCETLESQPDVMEYFKLNGKRFTLCWDIIHSCCSLYEEDGELDR